MYIYIPKTGEVFKYSHNGWLLKNNEKTQSKSRVLSKPLVNNATVKKSKIVIMGRQMRAASGPCDDDTRAQWNYARVRQ